MYKLRFELAGVICVCVFLSASPVQAHEICTDPDAKGFCTNYAYHSCCRGGHRHPGSRMSQAQCARDDSFEARCFTNRINSNSRMRHGKVTGSQTQRVRVGSGGNAK